MALQFNPPPEWILQDYMNRKNPADMAAEGINQSLQTYVNLKKQQQDRAFQEKVLASEDAKRKAQEFGAIAPYIPEAQIPAYAQSMGLNIPNQTPVAAAPMGVEPNFTSATGAEQLVAPSGSPIIDHFNSLTGQTPSASAGGGMPPLGPRPTSKFGLEKYQKNLAMNKLEQDVAPKQMYDQAGNFITTIPANAQVVPTQKQVVTPEERETAKRQAKIDFEKPKAKGSLDMALHEYDNMINLATQIANDPNLKEASGIATPLGRVYGTKAKGIRQKIETLKGKTLLNVMGSLKQLSSTGSTGFGAMSNIEGEGIKNSITPLDPGQSPEDLRNSLMGFAQEMGIRKQNLINTYQDTYGETYSTPSYMQNQAQQANPATGSGTGTGEVVRQTKDGKRAVFDANTKQFLRWQ